MKLRWIEPVLAPIGVLFLRLLAATWRVSEQGIEHRRGLGSAPFIYVLWHSRIFPLLYHHRHQDIVLLISRHRDGGYLADVAARWGYRAVRGSSKHGGAAGLLGIVRELQSGARVAITPDGPQGPPEKVKAGAIAAAQHGAAPLLPLAARASAAWWIQSWDRFCIPKPFARVEIVYGPPIHIGPGREGIERGVSAVEQALSQLMGAA